MAAALSARGVAHLADDAAFTNVTFRNYYNAAVVKSSGSGKTFTLNSVLIENGVGAYAFWGDGANALHSRNCSVFNVTNLVIRDLVRGNSALALDHWEYQSPTAINISGCFTHEAHLPDADLTARSTTAARENAPAR